ncbi:unknown protein 1 isoform X2 [Malania oleifera]|nr:unknown protein 1 isoform X2 [Malania oleifera]
MDCEDCTDLLKTKGGVPSHELLKRLDEVKKLDEAPKLDEAKKVDEVCDICEADKGIVAEEPLLTATEGIPCIGPITPDHKRENGEFLFDSKSPLTLVSSSRTEVSSDLCGDDDPTTSSVKGSPRTPREGVFDPFAPGPEELLALAPMCKKSLAASQISVSRQLHFESSLELIGDGDCGIGPDSPPDEDKLLESVYGTLLDAIVSEQAEGVLAKVAPIEESDCDGFKTPDTAPRLNGVAETCPAAPMKTQRKLRNIDLGLRRKLEF